MAKQWTDAQLAAVTVGDRVPLNDKIHLEPYNPQWRSLFAQLDSQIRSALGDAALAVEHVGSTSVPGLRAKPIIDVVLVVADSANEASYVPALQGARYVLKIREPNWFEHRMFNPPDIAGNVHVFTQGCAEIDQMLAFRDRLRASDADRTRYSEEKQRLAARTWRHGQHYAEAKSDVIHEILGRAGRD